MGWLIAVILISLLCWWLDSRPGKISACAGVVAIGCLLLRWITGANLFMILARVCAVVIVVTVVIAVLVAIIDR